MWHERVDRNWPIIIIVFIVRNGLARVYGRARHFRTVETRELSGCDA